MNHIHAYVGVQPIRLDQVEVRAVVACHRTNVRLVDIRSNTCLRSWMGPQYDVARAKGHLDDSSPAKLLKSAHSCYVAEKTRETVNGWVYSGSSA